MQIDPGIFKAYDIRGIYPNQLNEEAAYAIGRAFATFLKVDTVIVGRDMRLSGPQIFDAVTRGLMDQGTDVINIGMVSTDQYYFACATLNQAGSTFARPAAVANSTGHSEAIAIRKTMEPSQVANVSTAIGIQASGLIMRINWNGELL